MIGTGDEHMEADPDLFLERYAEWVKNFGVTFSEAMLPIIKASIPIAGLVEKVYPYYWRVRTHYPERFHSACRVLVRGKMNSCLVEFTDGFKTVTSRNYVRRWEALK